MSQDLNEKKNYEGVFLVITIPLVIHMLYVFGLFEPILGDNKFTRIILLHSVKSGIYIRLVWTVALFIWFKVSPKYWKTKLLKSFQGRITVAILWSFVFVLFIGLDMLTGIYLKVFYVITFFGMFVLTGLLTSIFSKFKNNIKDDFGIKNDSKKMENEWSFNLPTDKGWWNLVNPFRGVFFVAGPGGGKTASFSLPIIEQGVKKQYAGLTYDFKFPELTNYTYTCFKKFGTKKVKLKIMDFDDPKRSHRGNPIHPDNMRSVSHATDYSEIIWENLNAKSIDKEDQFFAPTAKAMLKATIWYLKKFHPDYCTIPHAVSIITNENYIDFVAKGLTQDLEINGMISSVATAVKKKATDQISGVFSSVQLGISALSDMNLFWVLSGNDFSFELNNPDNPILLCIGSREPSKAINPIIALITTVAIKRMNVSKPKYHQSWFMIDEAAQIYIPGIEDLPATGRSRLIATFILTQDISQMFDLYKEKCKKLLASLSNKFFGYVSNPETIKYIKDVFGKDDKVMEGGGGSRSQSGSGSSESESESFSLQERELVKSMDMRKLKPGEYKGIMVDTETMEFDARFSLYKQHPVQEVPEFSKIKGGAEITEEEITKNFYKIKREADAIINAVI